MNGLWKQWKWFAASILLAAVFLAGCVTDGGEEVFKPLARDASMTDSQNFARDIAYLGASHSPHTGVHVFESSNEALVAFVRLIDGAESTLDMRYPGWQGDDMGRFFLARLGLAAERGIRVRLLVDAESDRSQWALLAAYDFPPRMEIRLLESVADAAGPLPHLRHKLLTADNRLAMVDVAGIEMTPSLMTSSGDVLVIGPVLPAMARCFFEDWSSERSKRITSLQAGFTPAATISAVSETYSTALRGSRIARVSSINELSFLWGDVALRGKTIVRDGKGCR